MSQRSGRATEPHTELRQACELHAQGQFEQARRLYQKILHADPENADVLHFFGVLEAQQGHCSEAASLIGRSIARNPGNALAHYNLGNAFRDLKRREDALASYGRALVLNPLLTAAWGNRGAVLEELGRAQEALACLDKALSLDPNDVIALSNRGNTLRALQRTDEALTMYGRALALAPDHLNALVAQATTLQSVGRYQEALAIFERAVALDPSITCLEGYCLQTKMQMCRWDGLAEQRARLDAHILAGECAADPFVMLAASASPEAQLRCAEIYTAQRYPASAEPLWRGETYDHRKIRIGYVSGELRAQATAYLTADLFECHDRTDFEIYAIATGRDDASPMRKRLEKAFDVFWNVSAMSDRAIAERIREWEIDILVDLNGYFGHERTGLFALRPSPVQVNYLGFPGTMGAPYMDYIVADRIVLPDEMRRFYTEQAAYLPQTYQPNDRRRPRDNRAASRAAAGLPEMGLVFCTFNNTHKLTPEIFEVWMRLLKRVEGSVLWLLEANPFVRRNLLREAQARGVPENRLVFTMPLMHADHLARLGLADLFLDSLPHNAHTTASDALWCGVPVLTCLGTTFAGRVAGSLLQAAGLPELVTHSLEAYEAMALGLANEPGRLAALKARLARDRDTCPLFDTPRYARHLESAYRTMWQRRRQGLPPASFAVDEMS